MLGREIARAWRNARPESDLTAVARPDVDLRDRGAVLALLQDVRPDIVIHAAARVGGILDKIEHPTTYLLDNLMIDAGVIGGAIESAVPSLLYVGSGAIYPEHHRQPFVESDVLAGPLESANEGYAIAKIAGAKLCEYASREYGLAYKVALPSNLYGPGDDFSEGRGHLVAAALGKVHRAHSLGDDNVSIWGDGTARREFTYARDVAGWLVQQADGLDAWPPVVNVGVGIDHSIAEYYEAAARVVGYRGEFVFDSTKPSGMHSRLLDSTVAAGLGWSPTTDLDVGMARTYAGFTGALSEGKAS